MGVLFVLGMFLDWVGILLLTVPIFLPIMKSLPFAGALRLARCRSRQDPLVVRRHLHGQHADGLPESAVRVFAVLSQERGPAADQHGDDLPGGAAVHRPAGAGARHFALFSRNRPVAAAACSTPEPSEGPGRLDEEYRQRRPGSGSQRPPLPQCLRERAAVDVLELAADGDTAGEARHREAARGKQFAE